MKITPASDDAPDFVSVVEQIVNGVLRRHVPEVIIVIKIDNWFGSKWLGFAGKTLGALGVWSKPHDAPADHIAIPPFVPNRVVCQRRFSAPKYEEIDAGKPIHADIPSEQALVRKMALVAPRTTIIWYSGNSRETGRGAVMAYASVADSYWPWYAAWAKAERWQVTETWDIKLEDLSRLQE